MGKVITLFLANGKLILILLSFFKIGFVKTKNKNSHFSGLSFILGIWRIEIQFNILYVRDKLISFKNNDYGRA